MRYLIRLALTLFLTCIALPTMAQERTLYQRLGGYDAIVAVVSEFADKLFKDPKLERFFGGMSHDTRKRFKQLNVDLVCNATGGPCEYLGRSMPQAHQGARIRDSDFDQVAGHLVSTLDKFKVPKKEKDELETKIQAISSRIEAIQQLRAAQRGPLAVLEELRDRIDNLPGLYLKTVEQKGDTLSIEGSSPNEDTVTRFGRSLEFSSGLFTNLNIETAKSATPVLTGTGASATPPKAPETITFKIRCSYTLPGTKKDGAAK